MRQRLGKTWTAFADYTLLREKGEVDWFFVICPNSLKLQWYNDLLEANPYIPIHVYSSQSKIQMRKYFRINKRGGVFIINYESLDSFTDMYLKDDPPIFQAGRVFLVADESTKIKDPTATMTKAAHALAELCAYKRVLTGKPTANSNADMWGQLKFIDATKLNAHQFRHYYVVMGGIRGRQVLKNINTEILRERMAPFCYIAPDKYIKGFEKVYEPMRRVNLTGELERLYREMQDELVLAIKSDVKITAPIVLTQYLRLQQISSGIAGDEHGNQHNLVSPSSNPRIRVVREILDNEIDHKVIIPYRFRLSGDNLQEILSRDGHKVTRIAGDMTPSEIEEQKALFNKGDSNVLLGQLQTLSFGHTLPGNANSPCGDMIFYENDFSLLNRMQCESRPEEYVEGKPVQKAISYYDMYASKMDRYILRALIKKEDAALKLMGYVRSSGFRPEGIKEEVYF